MLPENHLNWIFSISRGAELIEKLRPREDKRLAQDYRVSQWRGRAHVSGVLLHVQMSSHPSASLSRPHFARHFKAGPVSGVSQPPKDDDSTSRGSPPRPCILTPEPWLRLTAPPEIHTHLAPSSPILTMLLILPSLLRKCPWLCPASRPCTQHWAQSYVPPPSALTGMLQQAF